VRTSSAPPQSLYKRPPLQIEELHATSQRARLFGRLAGLLNTKPEDPVALRSAASSAAASPVARAGGAAASRSPRGLGSPRARAARAAPPAAVAPGGSERFARRAGDTRPHGGGQPSSALAPPPTADAERAEGAAGVQGAAAPGEEGLPRETLSFVLDLLLLLHAVCADQARIAALTAKERMKTQPIPDHEVASGPARL